MIILRWRVADAAAAALQYGSSNAAQEPDGTGPTALSGADMARKSILLKLSVAPERQSEFEELMASEITVTQGFPGCERFEVFSTASLGEVFFLEEWASEEALSAYDRWRTERGDMERLGAFFTGPPARYDLRALGTTPACAENGQP